MSDLTYMALKLGFLALMWVLVFGVVYALRSDLFGQRVRKVVAKARQQQVAQLQPAGAGGHATAPLDAAGDAGRVAARLVIVDGPKQGLEVELPPEQLTIGRSSESDLVIRDDFTSSHHARLLRWPDGWVIQDLDSTNGTLLGGERVHGPTPVPLRVPIQIGTTTFELRD